MGRNEIADTLIAQGKAPKLQRADAPSVPGPTMTVVEERSREEDGLRQAVSAAHSNVKSDRVAKKDPSEFGTKVERRSKKKGV